MKRCRFITLSIMFHLLSGACLHLALAAGDPEVTIRRTSSKIQIDGILNDAAWQEKPSLTALVQVEPHPGEPSSQPTRVWDGIWNVRTHIDDHGWSAEFEIPFKTIGITMFVVPKVLELFMHDGWDANIEEQIGHKIGDLSRFATYEEFLEEFKKEFAYFIRLSAEKLNIESIVFRNMFPDPFRAALMDGGIQSGLDCYAQNYDFENNQLLNPVGMVNLAQSLYAIKKLVYEERTVTFTELLRALDANWQGYEMLRAKCLALSQYGNGVDEVDEIVGDCYSFWADVADTIPSILGGHFRCSAISITSHQPGGALVGATLDGRHAGEILADACASPIRGADTKGPLAVFRSALHIPQDRFQAMLMNMKIHPSALQSDGSKLKLASAIRTYFANGGKHVQFIVCDAKTLEDAKIHPDEHRDLMVRVAGYSAYFVQLTPGMQDEVIARTAHRL